MYRYIGSGGTVERPTKTGPAMIFNNIKGHPDARVLIGLLASRKRAAHLIGVEPDRVAYALNEALNNPITPRYLDKKASMYVSWCRHPLTPPKTQVPILRSACAMPPTLKQANMM